MKLIGIVLAGGNNNKMQNLTAKRAVAAMPIGGAYRAIDFVLSSMSNSHIQRVAVLTQYNSRSLNEHLSSSKWWDFGRKQGGLFVFTPTITAENSFWYRGTADSIAQNLDFLRKCHEPYVAIASGDGIYKLDYNKVLEYHVSSGADITIVGKRVDKGIDVSRFGTLEVDEENRITDFVEKPTKCAKCSHLISTGIYIIRRRLLIELIEQAASEERFDFVSDILIRYKDERKMYCYEMEGYWTSISSADAYFNANMDFLDPEVRDYFFNKYPDIHSKVDDLPPAKYNPGANVKNALLASGCIINGTVENSVLFKKVYVGNNTTIRNCIILNDSYIGDNVYLENCIVESRGTIASGASYMGEPGHAKVVVEKSERYRI